MMQSNSIVKKIVRHYRKGTLLPLIVVHLDSIILKNLLNFRNYYSIQKTLGFPIQKINFKFSNKYNLNLKNPRSFNEKCTFLKLYSRNPLLPVISDKYMVRQYVADKIGKDFLIPLLQVTDNPDNIEFSKLPKEFIIKPNFASGKQIIIDNKTAINHESIKNELNAWIRTKKYRHQELIWFVQDIERKIIIEKLLKDSNGKLAADYKCYVFKGEIKMITVVTDRFSEKKYTHFDKNWNQIDMRQNDDIYDRNIIKPENLEEMFRIAEILGNDFDFMRVDLYSVENKIYFGELTACPGDGRLKINPISYDYKLGSYWNMDLTHVKF